MSPRLLRNLLVALGLGIALWWGLAWLGRRGGAPLAGAGAKEKITKIEIIRPDSALTLEKLEGWQATAPRSDGRPIQANAGAVSRLVEAIADLRLEEAITENPSRQAAFEVDDPSGTRLRAAGKDGAVLLDLIVGKASADGNRLYVRRPGEAAVRLAGGLDPTSVRRETQDWFDRTLLRFDPQAVSAVEIRGASGRVTLAKSSASWTVNGLPASTTAVQNYINSFSGAWADEVVLGTAPARGLGLEKPRVVLAITDAVGPHVLTVGVVVSVGADPRGQRTIQVGPPSVPKRRYVRATPGGLLFRVSDAAIQTWDKPAAAFHPLGRLPAGRDTK